MSFQPSTPRKLRFAILAAAGVVFGLYFLNEGIQALRTGVVSFTLGKSGGPYTYLRAEAPFKYYFHTSLDLLLGCLFVGSARLSFRAFRNAATPKETQVANTILNEIEKQAPSGLTPLWIAFAIVAVVTLLYLT